MKIKKTYPLLLAFFFYSCSNLLVNEPSTKLNMEDFDSAWKTTKNVYPFFKYKNINWDSLYTIYRPQAAAAKGDEIYNVFIKMYGELKDGHVDVISASGISMPTYIPPREIRDEKTFDPLVVRKYFDKELLITPDYNIEYGVLNNNIGYIRIPTLLPDLKSSFSSVLDYLKNTKALIIDARNDGGGSDNNSDYLVSRLITSTVENLPVQFSTGGILQYPIQPSGPYQYTNPTVLLINGACFSSCEDFAAMMKGVPTVTEIGDTTAGASGAPAIYPLPSGKKIRISTEDIMRLDRQPIEWNGIIPNILITQTQEDINNGIDKQLESAIKFLNNKAN